MMKRLFGIIIKWNCFSNDISNDIICYDDNLRIKIFVLPLVLLSLSSLLIFLSCLSLFLLVLSLLSFSPLKVIEYISSESSSWILFFSTSAAAFFLATYESIWKRNTETVHELPQYKDFYRRHLLVQNQ